MPAEKTEGTHYKDEKDMDRRLKLYREHNSQPDNAVHDFFARFIDKDNIKTVESAKEEPKIMASLQKFIEKNGKPCCLNLITDKDIKFLKQLEKKAAEGEND